MGHAVPSAIFTTRWELVDRAASEVHEAMRLYGATKRAASLGQKVLWRGHVVGPSAAVSESPGGSAIQIACAVRVNWYGGGLPTISVDFRRMALPASGENRAPMTVRIGLQDDHRSGGELARIAGCLAQLTNERRRPWSPRTALRRIRAARLTCSRGAARVWWVDPAHTPVDVTRFALLLYLWQADLITLDPDGPDRDAWQFARAFVRPRPRHDAGDTTCWEALSRMRTHFALPQSWKGLRQYLARVVRDLERTKAVPEVLVPDADEMAAIVEQEQRRGEPDHRYLRGLNVTQKHWTAVAHDLGVTERTIYLWVAAGRVPAPPAPGAAQEAWERTVRAWAAPRLDERKLRREALALLTGERGYSHAAARKLLWRRQASGQGLSDIVARLRRGGCPPPAA